MRTIEDVTLRLIGPVLILILSGILVYILACGHHKEQRDEGEASVCSVTKQDAETTITCPDGTIATVKDGTTGIKGETGEAGEKGAPGEKGVPGKPGAPGTFIQAFIPCPELAGTYPETLFCIDDQLYAVYDANSAEVRLAKIPPGNYRTTDGRNCVFSVGPVCEIR